MKNPAHTCKLLVLFGFLAIFTHQESQALVMGKNDRERIDPDDYWSTGIAATGVMRIQVAPGRSTLHCTGVLLRKDMMLTAAHCLGARKGDKTKFTKERMTFAVNYELSRDGKTTTVAHSSVVTLWKSGRNMAHPPGANDDPNYHLNDDWAIMKLENELPIKIPRMKISPPKTIEELARLDMRVAGYGKVFSGMFYPTYQEGCRIRLEFQKDVLAHDCDVSQGDSGAPIYQCPEGEGRCILYGLHISSSSTMPSELTFSEWEKSTTFPFFFDASQYDRRRQPSRDFHRINVAIGTSAFYEAYRELIEF